MKTYLRVLEAVESSGVKAWLVGASARDVVMDIQPTTLTIAVENCDLEALRASIGDGVILGVLPFHILHATILGTKVEISCIQGDTIEDDLARRDFTVNAIAIRSNDNCVDPYGGRHDIRNKLIRLTGDDENLIKDDPIRVIRLIRFSSELDMRIFWKSEADARIFTAKYEEEVRKMPPERWGREILHGMIRHPYNFISICNHYNLLPFFLDDLEQLKKINIKEGGTLFGHTLDTLSIVQNFLNGRKRRDNDIIFSLAALFHHVGSVVNEPTDTGKMVAIAERYLTAWNLPSETVTMVCAIIKHYRLPYNLSTEESLAKSVVNHGAETVEAIVDFAICNSQADNMKNIEAVAANKWMLGEVLRRFEEAKRRTDGNIRYLSGDEIMNILSIRPSKVVGDILGELDIAVGVGKVSNKKEAADWVVKRGAGVA